MKSLLATKQLDLHLGHFRVLWQNQGLIHKSGEIKIIV